jgi:hypothetical protein
MLIRLSFHPVLLQYAEESWIGLPCRTDATTFVQNVTPSSTVARSALSTKAHIFRADSTEEHEDADDNVGRGRDTHPRAFLYDACATNSCLSKFGS